MQKRRKSKSKLSLASFISFFLGLGDLATAVTQNKHKPRNFLERKIERKIERKKERKKEKKKERKKTGKERTRQV